MKPYGREGNIKGGNNWKIDYRIRKNGRKLLNWWEDIKDFCRKSARRNAKKQIRKDLENDN